MQWRFQRHSLPTNIKKKKKTTPQTCTDTEKRGIPIPSHATNTKLPLVKNSPDQQCTPNPKLSQNCKSVCYNHLLLARPYLCLLSLHPPFELLCLPALPANFLHQPLGGHATGHELEGLDSHLGDDLESVDDNPVGGVDPIAIA